MNGASSTAPACPSPAGPAPLLVLDRVGFDAGGRALVDDVSLTLAPGRLTVVVGPNGAGKTSLLRLAAGSAAADRGRVVWEGEDARSLAPWRLAAMRAVMSQSTEIGFAFSVAEVVGLGFDGVGRRRDGRDRLAAIARALAAADVGHLAGRAARTLSGGERQRVLFARALAQLDAGRAIADRRALLLDEPVASLDLAHQIALMESARAIADDGVAVLAILHDLNLAATFADEIAVLRAGRLVAAGPPDAVLTDAVLAAVFTIAPRESGSATGRGPRPVIPQTWRVLDRGDPRRAP